MSHSTAYEIVSAIYQSAVILLLFTFLVQKEVLKAMGGVKAERWIRKLNWAIAPLVLLFCLIIGTRLSSFIF